ncbi:MAG TPA: ABC transporter permease [Nevskiales bacterium]|nr:ABC transporter permease [Nevskiales bacterium]
MGIDQIVIDAARPRKSLDLRELWRYRDLLYVLVRRDVAVRYRQTALGVLWAILQPLATMLIFTLIFGRLARMPSDGLPYSLFAFAGLLPWIFFASTLNAVGNSVVNSSNLVTKVYFPRLIIPLAAIGAPCLDLFISTLFMCALMAIHGFWPAWSALWLPVLFLAVVVTAVGTGSLIAALNVSYRDFRHLLQPLITLWLFATPVIYPPAIVPEDWRWLLFLNPMAGIVTAIRAAWFGLPFDLTGLGLSLAVSVCLLIIGLSYFRSVERRFADII